MFFIHVLLSFGNEVWLQRDRTIADAVEQAYGGLADVGARILDQGLHEGSYGFESLFVGLGHQQKRLFTNAGVVILETL